MQNATFTETQRKAKYDVSSTLGWGGGDFRCYSSCSLKVDHLFDKPIIKKMRQNLKHSVEMTQQYSKYPYGPKKAYKGRHYKGKTYDDRSSQQQQSCNKNNNNQD